MGLNLDADCQAALNLAKRTVPDGAELDAARLMAALYFSSTLKDRLPQLADLLERPPELRGLVSSQVPVAESLQPVLKGLAESGEIITPEKMFSALLHAKAGRECLIARGMAESEFDQIVTGLG